jgi:hypothetical protein
MISGYYTINGQVFPNYLTIEGANDIITKTLLGSTDNPARPFYMGFIKAGTFNTYTPTIGLATTLASLEGLEFTGYEGQRPLWIPNEGWTVNGVLSNDDAPVTVRFEEWNLPYLISAQKLRGIFLCDVEDKDDYTGTLYSIAPMLLDQVQDCVREITYTTKLVLVCWVTFL